MAPEYIVALLTSYEPECNQISSNQLLVVASRSNFVIIGGGAFALRAPKLPNELPGEICTHILVQIYVEAYAQSMSILLLLLFRTSV